MCAVLAALVVVVGCWSISVGDFPIPITDVVATIFGGGSDDAQFIVETLRLPRVLTGIMVGAAFAVAGSIFQSLAQNPLASPDVIGFNSGAALGAVFTIVTIGGSSLQVSIGALVGGFATALLVYSLAWKRGVHGYRLVLVGIGIGFAVSAVNDYLITRANIYDVQRAAVWLTGSLNGRGWNHVRPVGLGLLVLLPPAVFLGRRMRLLELGADTAAALGVHVGRSRAALALVGVALAALATASAGPIGFVALVSPPIARRLVRSPGVTVVPAALVGALLTVTADLAARRVFAPTELPVGIATAVIGAPYLLWLLTREIRSGAM
ncbi:MAG: iron chelate uptake ABC transporter family permease subunit [Actinomycetota bacterium]|nr:iron chelate uptake ABC transporter family permease subunit [Actinomycetota bacterium]